MSLSFSAAIDEWVKETEARMNAVFRESARRIISLSQEYIVGLDAIDTGFMRGSVTVSLSSMPKIDPAKTEGLPGGEEYVLQIAGARIGQTIYAGYTAAYSRHVHDGTSKMAGRPYIYLAALQWPRVVYEVSQELKGRVTRANLDRAFGRG